MQKSLSSSVKLGGYLLILKHLAIILSSTIKMLKENNVS